MAYQDSVTDRQWEKWARQNPYYGVLLVETNDLSDEKVRDGFFRSGVDHIGSVLQTAETLAGDLAYRDAVDFGCGVGRLLLPLSERFEQAVGIDVSETMLELARGNLRERDNVDFVRTPQQLLDDGKSFDFVHSYIVLQHIRPVQGMDLILQLAKLTRPGGVFALHFTIGDSRKVRYALNQLRYHVPPVHYLYNLARKRIWNESITEMNRYRLGAVLRMLAPLTDNQFHVQFVDQAGHDSVMLFGKRSG